VRAMCPNVKKSRIVSQSVFMFVIDRHNKCQLFTQIKWSH